MTARQTRYEILDQGKNVVFLTLGDPTVYSTYMYVHQRLEAKGYPVAIVSGITSFCAVAARMNMSLVERSEPLHVIPASYQIEEALKLPGTKVLMKAGKQMKYVQEQVKDFGKNAVMIETAACRMRKSMLPGKRSRKAPVIIR